ncbi:MAG TPA: sigma 54-interacting transcriptional regulator [Burkholderiaceae bacterium]|nr:sigma 54-interacting transcriptional regulator [Burkholderiaceae bacterium]
MRLDDESRPPALDNQEAVLRLTAASFFGHLSEMCEGILVVDRDARIAWVSDRYERYLPNLGFSRPDEIIGRPVEEIVPNTLMRRVVETGQPILLDIIDGKDRSFVVSRFPLRDSAGDVIGAVGLILYDHVEALKPILNRLGNLQRDLDEARRQLATQRRTKYSFASFVGNSQQTIEVKSRARRAAALNSTVLLIGETGTGKELIAQAIHAASARASRPFIAVNVAAIPETLLEAEFFGVAPGAYTGADRRMRDGKLKLADGGTLLLDEIGDMPLPMQAKLLRVLQEQEFEPVGSNSVIRIDVRVIAATSRDLKSLVERGAFRADLFYRLNVLPIRIPPLRERVADLPALIEHLLEQIAAANGRPAKELTPDAIAALQRLPWPGNVRELRNVLEQACAMTDRMRLTLADLTALLPALAQTDADADLLSAAAAPLSAAATAPETAPAPRPAATTLATTPPIAAGPALASVAPVALSQQIARLERDAIAAALAACRGNKRDAARMLGISRGTFYQRLKSYQLLNS